MTDPTAQPTPQSYVDTYAPPQVVGPTPASAAPTPMPAAAPQAPTLQTAPLIQSQPAPAMPQPGAQASSAPAPQSASSQSPISQALEDQNIFFLLGVTEAVDEEKEAFLDELQQVIWEDFLENDVELLVTDEEMAELKKIMAAPADSELEQQEAIVVYLEKLIPDLEEIMLEKALELKADMVKERIAGIKEYYAEDQSALTKVAQAEEFVADDQWRQAAEVLNTIV